MLVICITAGGVARGIEPIADMPFSQEYRDPFLLGTTAAENDVRAVAIDEHGRLWAASAAGIRVWRDGAWQAPTGEAIDGPAFDVLADPLGNIWVAAWNGVYRVAGDTATRTAGLETPVRCLVLDGKRLLAAGPDGYWEHRGTAWEPLDGELATSVRDIAATDGTIWAATGIGVYRRTADGGTRRFADLDALLDSDVRALTLGPDSRVWIGSEGGIDVYEGDRRVASYTGAEGLPSTDVYSLSFDEGGILWVGTSRGVARARFDGSRWSLRHSLRWLPSDRVRDVAFGPDGAAYVATSGGVAVWRRREMTLADKAAHFQEIMEARHKRPPGLVRKCRLKTPGDVSSFEPMDTDNDGLFTGTYLGAQCYRYAATQDPAAKAEADAAYQGMEFLQTVTETPGFVARTVIPIEWTRMADPNRQHTPQEIAEMRIDDPRYKPVDVRWHKSRDGKWLWKGDTSSDEITGHYFAYALYFDLVADDETKERVREHVRRITDYIIDGGFTLRDVDGQSTRWGNWSPERLSNDPNWISERGINAVEILSFLAIAHHMTGDNRYERLAGELYEKHDYGQHILKPQPSHPGMFTYIDSNLLALVYPALVGYAPSDERRRQYAKSMQRWFEINRFTESPLYNLVYGGLSSEACDLDRCAAFLRDAPLDLIAWTVDNSHREDTKHVRRPYGRSIQNDLLLPPSERAIIQWDGNPFAVANGSGGNVEASAAYWLLPYWLGRYHGLIEGPAS